MRHEINSYNTKNAIAQALKDIVAKGKNKVTISDIISTCGVSKNTFYYHFSDIIELINWTLKNDFYTHIRSFDSTDGKQIREFVTTYFSNNTRFLNFAYQHIGFDGCWECFVGELYPIIYEYIEKIEHRFEKVFSPNYKKFLAEFYSEQVGSIYLMQFRKPDRYHKGGALKCLELIFDYSIPDMLAHEGAIGLENMDPPDKENSK